MLPKVGEPAEHLAIRIEPIVPRPSGAWFVKKITLGHAHVIGAKDTAAGTRVGFGEHGDGGHATEGAGWFFE